MRKLILQIRYTIFSRSLCVRHLQTILPYSPYLHGIFTIYSNFTPHTRIYFCKAESFFAELELTFSIHPFFLLRAVYVMDSLHNHTQRTDIRSLNAQKGMIKFINKCI